MLCECVVRVYSAFFGSLEGSQLVSCHVWLKPAGLLWLRPRVWEQPGLLQAVPAWWHVRAWEPQCLHACMIAVDGRSGPALGLHHEGPEAASQICDLSLGLPRGMSAWG